MIDQIRRDIQERLNQLLAEAEKLRHALAALGSQDGSSSSSTPAPARRRQTTTRRARSTSSSAARPRTGTRAASASGTRSRTASGATKTAVLQALRGGKAMTAGEVASATGLGRASVSTTLSKLSKSGEVNKAQRGYTLAK
jgi:DNA-binding transcriptional ArsR family regulator